MTRRPPTPAHRFSDEDDPEPALPTPDDGDDDTAALLELGLDCFEVDAL